MNNVVNKLIELNKTISTMESCTGGYIVNEITNVSGASDIIKFSCITYSNEYKIKMGVSKETIDKYSVYSMEVAREMSKCISKYCNSNYGIGITGKLGKIDKNNLYGDNNKVYISIYNKDNDNYITKEIIVNNDNRSLCKKEICDNIVLLLMSLLEE